MERQGSSHGGQTFQLVSLDSGEDYLWRPVLAGVCRWKEVIDGTYTLCDIADMNDALDVQDENQRRREMAQHEGR